MGIESELPPEPVPIDPDRPPARDRSASPERARLVAAHHAGTDVPLEAQGVRLDPGAYLVYRDGEILPPLPLKEFLVLKVLLEHAGQAVASEVLLTRVWGEERTPGLAGSLSTHIARLRHRLERDPNRPERIRTVRGVGFIFDVEPVPRAERQ